MTLRGENLAPATIIRDLAEGIRGISSAFSAGRETGAHSSPMRCTGGSVAHPETGEKGCSGEERRAYTEAARARPGISGAGSTSAVPSACFRKRLTTCTGMANPTSGPLIMVLMPTNRPSASSSGPPE